ncbi:rab3 GTPase-activating protein catalytic subunit [Diaphorina citri]|uniref:Rab3 GTPase-activating protein catalytic subunit n=1 Tax=Diaphorina citri TaxID=121845 RepID=A0A1S3D487_DIACI|nr:rab3 GTPase-activating protein catalytic subunit [Diaphorina citri]
MFGTHGVSVFTACGAEKSVQFFHCPTFPQDPIPKTEDQIEEDAEFLLSLGTDLESSQLRAKLMSASLLSDMESFKAANPGAILEDFIRWYSSENLELDKILDTALVSVYITAKVFF